MANRLDPDQTLPHQEQSDLGLHCLSKGLLNDSRRRQMQMSIDASRLKCFVPKYTLLHNLTFSAYKIAQMACQLSYFTDPPPPHWSCLDPRGGTHSPPPPPPV